MFLFVPLEAIFFLKFSVDIPCHKTSLSNFWLYYTILFQFLQQPEGIRGNRSVNTVIATQSAFGGGREVARSLRFAETATFRPQGFGATVRQW